MRTEEDISLLQFFTRQVQNTPDASAVIMDDEHLTYAEIHRRVNYLASYLVKQGVSVDKPVGLLVQRSPQALIAILAILQAGGIVVPLDTSYPRDYLARIIGLCAPVILLTEDTCLNLLSEEVTCPVVNLTHFRLEDSAASKVESPSFPDQLCLILFTSGSTGQPKGVAIPHLQWVNRLTWMWQRYPFSPGERVCQRSLLNTGAAFWEFLGPILQGVPLVIASDEITRDGRQFLTWLARYGITRIKVVPSLLAILVELLEHDESLARHLPEQWTVGGEAITSDLIARFRKVLPQATLLIQYGCSEMQAMAMREVRPDEPLPAEITLGEPVFHTELYVLDEQLRPVAPFVPGELYVSSAAPARGYLDQPDLSAWHFLPHPFSKEPGKRLFRTGDRAEYLADGRIRLLGRTDHVVKIRGFRADLEHIETAICSHPDIQECVVTQAQKAPGEERLIAYVVTRLDAEELTVRLRAYLEKRLPSFMVPSGFEILQAIPLTPNGKRDRRRLPTPSWEKISLAGRDREEPAPRDPIESTMVEIWQQVFGLTKLGREDNFFLLGGHSLTAMRLLARVRERFGTEITFHDLFTMPTVAQFSQKVREKQSRGLLEAAPPTFLVDGDVPLSFAQQRLWFLYKLAPESHAYTIPILYRMRGRLDVEALEWSLQYLIARHESLRTTYHEAPDGKPFQRIAPVEAARHFRLAFNVVPEKEVDARIQDCVRRPFQLDSELMIRGMVFQTSPDTWAFLLLIHHIASDGWSSDILRRELATCYNAKITGNMPQLSPLSLRYRDYAYRQRQYIEQEEQNTALVTWLQKLKNPPILSFPTDSPQNDERNFAGTNYRFTIPSSIIARVREYCIRETCTLFMFLYTAFQVLVARYTGQRELVMGTRVAGRTSRELEELVGFFVNILVLRTVLDERETFRDLLYQTKDVTLEAYMQQDMPFDKIVEKVAQGRDGTRNPLVQLLFTLDNFPQTPLHMEGLSLQQQIVDSGVARFDLDVTLYDQGSSVTGIVQYNTDLFLPTRIEAFVQHYQTLLDKICDNLDQPLHHLSLLSAAEEQRICAQGRGAYLPSLSCCVHQLIERQAQRTPDTIALRQLDNTSLSYSELNRRANILAHFLREQGIHAESRVAIYGQRSLETILAILGTWKAGGAYIPLSANLPSERLRELLDEAKPELILASSDMLPDFTANAIPIYPIERCLSEHATKWSGDPEPINLPDHLAYILFTSGSTGRPKGVMVTHRSLVNAAQAWDRVYCLREEKIQTHLQMADFTFDVFCGDLIMALTTGGTLTLCPSELLLDAPRLYDVFTAHKVERAEFVPVVFTTLVRYLKSVNKRLDHMRILIIGSDALLLSAFHEAKEITSPQTRIINSYGLTEATIDSSCYEEETLTHPGRGLAPIGRPLSNMELYVLDKQMRLLPPGIPGEIYVGGEGLARGYWKAPEQTAASFVPHPFSRLPGQRLYRSGDLGQLLPDGNVELLGRSDFQVKLRGYRFELSDVEAALCDIAEVTEAIVTFQRDLATPERDTVLAYLLLQPGCQLSYERVSEHLRARLPQYMLPTGFALLSALPLLPNGKIDRQHLQEYVSTWLQPEIRSAPRTPEEVQMERIWCQVLHRESIDISANFFYMGGHSLLATQIMSRVRETFQVDLPLRVFFTCPTIAELSAEVVHARQAVAPAPSESDDVLQLLSKLNKLSEQEIDRMLNDLLSDESYQR